MTHISGYIREVLEKIQLMPEDEEEESVRQEPELTDKDFRRINIPFRFRCYEAKDFQVTPDNQKAFLAVDNISPTSGQGLYLLGPPGTGKTLLLCLAVKNLWRQGARDILFSPMVDVLADIRRSYSGNSDQSDFQILKKYQNKKVLVIDDIGKEHLTEWAKSQIFALINARYNSNRLTLVSTNEEPYELDERLGQPTVSRLMELCARVKVDGKDFRLNKFNQPTNREKFK